MCTALCALSVRLCIAHIRHKVKHVLPSPITQQVVTSALSSQDSGLASVFSFQMFLTFTGLRPSSLLSGFGPLKSEHH